MQRYDAVLFDLLTALIDSWTLWNRVGGTASARRKWRAEYLRLTYGCGAYRSHEDLVRESAISSGLTESHAACLDASWDSLQPWDDAIPLLHCLAPHYRLGVVTNCSESLGQRSAARMQVPFDCIVTAPAVTSRIRRPISVHCTSWTCPQSACCSSPARGLASSAARVSD